MNLTQKDLKKVVKAVELAARIDELDHLAPYVSSDVRLRRKSKLKDQLKELTGEKKEKEEPTININIEIPEKAEKKEKSYKFNLKNLFSKEEKEDDDVVLRIVRGILPEEVRTIGKLVEEM